MFPLGASPPEFFSYLFDNSTVKHNLYFFFLRKEVIQPHLPIRLPCYDFTPVIGPAFGSSSQAVTAIGFLRFRLVYLTCCFVSLSSHRRPYAPPYFLAPSQISFV